MKLKTIKTYPVYVYKNLHKNLWSIKCRNRVIGHTDYIRLEDCEFVVLESGKRKAKQTGVRNVHAFVKGFPVEIGVFIPRNNCGVSLNIPRFPLTSAESEVSYNPFNDKGFYRVYNQEEVKRANVVHMRIVNNKSVVLVDD